MDAEQWRRYARLSVMEGALATAMGTLLSGVFLTGFALSLGANRFAIGILAALPPLASLTQLVGARLIERGMSRKRLCIGALSIARLTWLPVLAIPLLAGASADWQIPGLILLVGLSSIFSSLGGVASMSWTREMVPEERRLGFLGIKHQFNTILALLLSLVGAGFIDWWNHAHPGSHSGFVGVLITAMFCGLLGIPVLRRIDEPANRHRDEPRLEAAPAPIPSPIRDRNFRNLVWFYICWNLATSLAAPFYAVFMLQNLKLPFWHIVALQTFFSIVGLIANRHWTALGRRLGTRPVVFLATLGDAFYPLCWVFLTPEATWALPLVFMFGAFGTPLAVGAPTLVMRLAPDALATSYLATYSAIMGVVMATAAIVGGYLATNLAAEPILLGGISMGGLKIVFLLSFCGRIASLFLLRRIYDPDAVDLRVVLSSTLATLQVRLRSAMEYRVNSARLNDPGDL